MREEKKERLFSMLEYPFDYEEYIQKRLREIGDLEERRFAKTILLDGMLKMIQGMEQKYQNLEHRIYEEIKITDSLYHAVITIVKKEHYDPVNDTLFLVCREDVQDQIRIQQLSTEQERYVGTIFLQMDQRQTEQFGDREVFHGSVFTPFGDQMTTFRVCPAKRYRERLEQLYGVFLDNHVAWDTINTGYFDKFFDVFIPALPEITEELRMEDCDIWFEEYAENVKLNLIPLWNLLWITFQSEEFMMPCMDGLYYEHEFAIEEGSHDGYLIQSNKDILEIRHEKDKIVMKSIEEKFEGWVAIRMVQSETKRSLDYGYPLLTNYKKDSFFRRYAQSSQVNLMTKADLLRRITELDLGEFIEVTDYNISSATQDFPVKQGMNWFVMFEWVPMDCRRVLLFTFRKKKEHYLNDSMMMYAISQMQLEISEFRCVGVFTEA